MSATASSPFATFAETADAIASTSSKLAKRDLLAAYLRGLPPADVPHRGDVLRRPSIAGGSRQAWLGLGPAVRRGGASERRRRRRVEPGLPASLGRRRRGPGAAGTSGGGRIRTDGGRCRSGVPCHERGLRQRTANGLDGRPTPTGLAEGGALPRQDRGPRATHRAAGRVARRGDRDRLRPARRRGAARPHARGRARRGGHPGS